MSAQSVIMTPMLKRLHIVCAWIAVALGLVHVGFTFTMRQPYSLGGMWFAAAGFAIIFAGFLNVALTRNVRETLTVALTLIANVIIAAFFTLGIPLFPGQPQGFFGLALFSLLTATTWCLHRQSRSSA